MAKEVIIALDFPGKKETLDFLDKFDERKPFVKIGMELFYAEGWKTHDSYDSLTFLPSRLSHK